MKRAEAEPNSPYASFASAIKRARAQGQMKLLERLEKHGEKQWLPNAWLLERTDQAQFALQHKDDSGPRVVVQIGIKDSDVQVTLTTQETLSPPTFASFAPEQGAGSD